LAAVKQLHRRLTAGAANDTHEKEADNIADEVMRMPVQEQEVQRSPLNTITQTGVPAIQRQIIIGSKPLAVDQDYVNAIQESHGKEGVAIILSMHNGGNPPKYSYENNKKFSGDLTARVDNSKKKIATIQAAARKSSVVTGLEKKVGIENYTIVIDGTDQQTRTDNINKIIYIDHRSTANEAVLGYTWELTNASNHDKDVKLRADALSGSISRYNFIMGIFTMEAEAYLNAATVNANLKIKSAQYSLTGRLLI